MVAAEQRMMPPEFTYTNTIYSLAEQNNEKKVQL